VVREFEHVSGMSFETLGELERLLQGNLIQDDRKGHLSKKNFGCILDISKGVFLRLSWFHES
jgi:hypothetical protein